MGCREIFHRTGRALSQNFEQMKLHQGWQPLPSKIVGSQSFLLPLDQSIEEQWQKRFSFDTLGLSEIIAGRLDFFGHPPVDVGSPVNWHQDPITHILSPSDEFGKNINYRNDLLVGNIKILWELGRHQHLLPLAAAYAVSGDVIYKNAVTNQIENWIKENQFDRGIHWCSALEVALRLISWAIIHSFFYYRDKNRGIFDAVHAPEALGISIHQHAWFVAHYLSRYSSANNHLIGELTGLWAASQIFDLGRIGEKWGKFAQKELEQEAQKQIFQDGVNKEQSTYYHLWVLEYFLFASLVGQRVGKPFSTSFEKTISDMATFLRTITPARDTPPQIGDSDDGFVARFEARWPENPYSDILTSASLIRENQAPENISQKAFWYGAMAGIEFTSVKTNVTNQKIAYPKIFPYGGYAVLGNELLHLVFNAGSLGYSSIAAHGHADALSVCLAVDGEWWLIDPGTYAYHSQPEWRNFFRGTSAHNTIEVDGNNQSQIGGPFLWVKHANVTFCKTKKNENEVQIAEGFHDGYKNKGIIHNRKIIFNPMENEFQIVDTITGNGKHTLSINYHFSPGIKLESDKIPTTWHGHKHKWQLEISGDKSCIWNSVSGNTKPIAGWYSPALHKKVPTNTLNGKWEGFLPTKLISVIKIDSIHEHNKFKMD